MAVLYRGAGVGTYWHTHDARAFGFAPKTPGALHTTDRLMLHIARGTVDSPYVSLTRSYGIAESYGVYFGRRSPSRTTPGYVYEIELSDPLPAGLALFDPVNEVAARARSPVGSVSYHHNGPQGYLLAVVDPKRFGRNLRAAAPQPPSRASSSQPPLLTMELETMVRALRDAEILSVGNIPAACVRARHEISSIGSLADVFELQLPAALAVGTFQVLRAEIPAEPYVPFALIRYSLEGKEREDALRLDVDKGVFVDRLGEGYEAEEAALDRLALQIADIVAAHWQHTETGHHPALEADESDGQVIYLEHEVVADRIQPPPLFVGELKGETICIVHWVDVVADGRRAISFGSDVHDQRDGSGRTQVWDLETGGLLCTLDGRVRELTPDGRRALTVGPGSDQTQVWDLDTGTLLSTLNGGVRGLTPDGRRALTVAPPRWEATQAWDLDTGTLLRTLNGALRELTPDGRCALTVGPGNDQTQVWDLDTGALLSTLNGGVRGLTPDGRRALTVAPPRWEATQVWDLDTGILLRTLNGALRELTPDGRRALTVGPGSDQTKVWDLDTCTLLSTLNGKVRELTPDGRRALTVGPGSDQTKVWDLDTGTLLSTLDGEVRKLARDGRRALTVDQEGKRTLVWDLDTGTLLSTLDGEVRELTSDGRRALTFAGEEEGTTSGLDLETGTLTPKRDIGTTQVWDLETGTLLSTLSGFPEALTPDGRLISWDGLRTLTVSLL